MQSHLAFVLLFTVSANVIGQVWSICEGKFSGKYFLSSVELTYKDAKQCCYKQRMEIFRITSPKDIPKFLDVVKNGHKSEKIKRFSFWIKKDSSSSTYEKDPAVAEKCPLIQWSTVGTVEPWTTHGFCGLKYQVVCVPASLKKYKAVKQGQLTFGKRRRKREEPELLMELLEGEGAACSFSATLNGYYISGEKLSFSSAKSCCASKNMQLVSSNLTDLEAANLKHSLCYTFREKVQGLWITSETSSDQNKCTSVVLEDGQYLREDDSECDSLFPALCESPEEDPDICEKIQYKELEGGAYLFSDLKVPFSQASVCCREQNMNLVNLYSYKESSAMYQIMLQNGLSSENLNFWTSGSRKFNSEEFTWHDGQPIILQDFTEYCIAALEKLNAKSFMVTDYGCERLLNFLCIGNRQRLFEKKIRKGETSSNNLRLPFVNDGFVTKIHTDDNLTSVVKGQSVLPLKGMTVVQYDLPESYANSQSELRSRTFVLPVPKSEISSPSPAPVPVVIEPVTPAAKTTEIPTQLPLPDSFNLLETLENTTLDVPVQSQPTQAPRTTVKEPRWHYKTCSQINDLNPSVSTDGILTVNDALKLVLLNQIYDMKLNPKSSVNMGPANWKKKYVNQLGRIFTEVCDDDELISKSFINVMMGLNTIYQSSFLPGPVYDANVWDKLYNDLMNCKPKKIELLAHAYEIYAMVEKEAFTTPDAIKQLFPPEELSEKGTENIDPIVDALWWMTTTAHAACYQPSTNNDSDSLWATHFKSAMQKDFFEPVNYRWRHSGHDHLFFGAIVGDYNLERTIRNMRYCATAAYWQSKMINRELVRGLDANSGTNMQSVLSAPLFPRVKKYIH